MNEVSKKSAAAQELIVQAASRLHGFWVPRRRRNEAILLLADAIDAVYELERTALRGA